jgi:eukaryotic-like serine/threonine-protein kinase
MGDEPSAMKPASPEQAVFAEALLRDNPEARAAYLDAACGTDAALRGRVETLLRAAEHAGDFLEQPPDGLNGDLDSIGLSEKPGDRVGRYKLLEKIGEGGCGVVYMAEQEEPVRRRVALKIIKLGMDTRSVVARFEAERQALALMDHPNIAKVLDGGATPTGRPYFVMELVRGVRITEFCDEAWLSTEARLRLFVQVCQAIQHAHQKGIIHRDLKPSNILVTVNDGAPVPKVIDFGIAKATGQRLTDKTLFTQFHAFIGTPAYTSPEQAEMSSVDIDTRSDIYSLGVLLYELLTGRTPFDGDQLLRAGLDEMRRIIRDEQPSRPSTRLHTLGIAEATALSGKRQVSISELTGDVRGDLDWVVMKCLEKDRSRRYETANGIAADIQRHLDNEPVAARPPSSVYRLQKLIRRNRGRFAALSAVLLVLVVGVCVSIQLLVRENAAMRRALLAEESAKAERLRNDRATRSMTKSGTAFLKRGDAEAAEKWLLEALGMRRSPADGEDKQAAELLSALAHLRHWQRDFAEVERLARESIDIRRRLQQDDPGLARTLNHLADARYERGDLSDAERFFREGLDIMRRNGTNDPNTFLWSLYALAETLERQDRFAEAEPLYRELLGRPGASEPIEDGVLSPAVGSTRCLSELAWIEQQQGKSADALSHVREAEAILRAGLELQPPPTGKRAWQLAEMKGRLGGALVIAAMADITLQPAARLNVFAEVESLLLECEERLREDPIAHPNFKRDAIHRLVRLYDAWNSASRSTAKLEKATQWKLRLRSFDKAEAERKTDALKPKPTK